ncbi:MAG: hypothetical protein JXA97_10330 [Anaerolineales bacterium]|nr:hypothetical protein [Anaerolineales bacterium]
MKTERKHAALMMILLAVLALTACGTMEIGIETPFDSEEMEESVLPPRPAGDPGGEMSTPADVSELKMGQAWFGHVASAPEGTAYDDQFILLPERTGAVGLQGRTTEMDEALASLRDAAGPDFGQWVEDRIWLSFSDRRHLHRI